MICVQTTEELSKTSTHLRVHPEASATSSLLGAAFYPEDILDMEPHSAILRPLPLEVLTSSGSLLLRDPPYSEGSSSVPESPTTDHPLSLPTVMQLHHFLRS